MMPGNPINLIWISRDVKRIKHHSFAALASLVLLFFPAFSAAGLDVKVSYLYNLSDFSGTIPYNWVKITSDKENNETYVVSGNSISIFNESGMEVYRFGDDEEFGLISDVAVEEDGHILLLTYGMGQKFSIVRSDFRGKPISTVKVQDLPSEFASLSPNRIYYRSGLFYLADFPSRKVVVTDSEGHFKNGYDLSALIKDEDKAGPQWDMGGFCIDSQGNILFTIPSLFKAIRLSPDGSLSVFGSPGSLPGQFNVVAGIGSDDQGNIFVIDTLRSVVMVYDKDFKFLSEFGSRGLRPGQLVAPKEVAADRNGRVYVSQSRARGVSVFQMTRNGS